MPELLKQEVRTLATSIVKKHGHHVTTIACLVHLTARALTHLGQLNGTDVSPLLEAQHGYLRYWMEHHGVTVTAVDEALLLLTQAGVTMNYLASIPR